MHSYALQLILYLAYFFWAHSKSFLDVIYIVLATIDLLVRPPTPVLCACAHTLAHAPTHTGPHRTVCMLDTATLCLLWLPIQVTR